MIMKILVPVKRVVDYNVKIKVKSDNSGVDLENVKMSMNPFDEIAVEEAVRLKEKGVANEVLVVSIGNDQTQETIRSALAIGADRGILVKTEKVLEPLAISKILSNLAKKEQIDLAIYSVIISEITTIFTVKLLLNQKTFHNNDDVYNLID